MKKIVLISPFPPAQNPRLLKEYESLKANHFDVKVLYAERDQWAANFKPSDTADFILVGGKYGSLYYYLTRILHKLLKNILPLAYGYDKVSWLLYLKGLSLKANLYIGHNLASLPIVVKLAKKTKSKCGFDAEDFHRNEVTDDQSKPEFIIVKILEDKFIEQTDYLTTASPLICQAYQLLYPKLKPLTINNVFSVKHLNTLNEGTTQVPKKLRLFWFSQTIGRARGIETVIEAIGFLKNELIELTLLGDINRADKIYFEKLTSSNGLSSDQLLFLEPVSPDQIFEIACKHDIGLALELNTPFNRDICLTNKIFTYLTSGLAVIASETTSQKEFMFAYPELGETYPIGNVEKLTALIDKYDKDRGLLYRAKLTSNAVAKEKMNWETESKKLISLIEKTLKD